MSVTVVLGAQWGDEGKGKVGAAIGKHFEVAARFQGGPNADHNVQMADRRLTFRMLPSAVLSTSRAILGNGMVLDPALLLSEIDATEQAVSGLRSGLAISLDAHLIFPEHVHRDRGPLADHIRSTGMGVGPAYADKVGRRGMRVRDLLARANRHRLDPVSRTVADRFVQLLGDRCLDTVDYLHLALSAGTRVIAQGAQGAMLDLDHGGYPVVTASSTTIGGALTGLGIGVRDVRSVLLVFSAYTSIRGGGDLPPAPSQPDPSRLAAAEAQHAAADKPGRYGWLHLPLLQRAARLNGADALILTKLDVLSALPEIHITSMNPADGGLRDIVIPGWLTNITGATEYSQLPSQAQQLVEYIEHTLQKPIVGISTGPSVDAYIDRLHLLVPT